MKIIDKILDNYYTKKLIKYIDKQTLGWFIDKNYDEYGNFVQLKIKKTKYNDNEYKTIMSFFKEDAFTLLCNQKEINKVLKERIDNYFKSEVE